MLFRSPVVRFFSRILNRVTITVVLVALQLLWLCWVAFAITTGTGRVWVNGLLNALSLLIVLYLVRKDENSAYKVGWIALIGILPLLGGALYLAFGNKRPSKRLSLKMHAVDSAHKKDLQQQPGVLDSLDAGGQGQSRYVAKYGPYPAWQNTRAQYFASGEAMYPQLLADLEKAQKSIFLEFFIVSHGCMWNGIEKILRRKAAQGVDVRLIYDDVGCIGTLPPRYYKQLQKKGIKCAAFNPFRPLLSVIMNNRDHRKIFVVDGAVGFTGGINLADEYINEVKRFGYWKDTGVRIEGEAVWSLTSMFLSMWNYIVHSTEDYSRFMPAQHQKAPFENDGFVQPYGDSPLDHENVGENIYLNIINRAKNYVYIFTPYLIIDHEMLTALCNAAKDGVDVRIVTPGIPDKKMIFLLTQSYYAPLIQSGVKIYQYTPGFIHAKCFVCDDEIATVGSVNLDFRSLYLHFECGVFFYRSAVVAQVKEDCLNTFACSEQMTAEFCRNRPVPVRLLQSVLRLLAPLL